MTFTNGSVAQLNSSSICLSYSQLQNRMVGYNLPASVIWTDCKWPVNVRWCCDRPFSARDIIYNDFVNVDKRNRQIRCGLVLCDVTKKGKYTIRCKPTVAGKVALYQSPTAVQYSTTMATLQEYTVPAGTESSLLYQTDSFVDNDAIWILFLPTSTSAIGTLDVISIELEHEN